ncbi:MAG TPA: LysE family translocator [Acetobacteraceae bacterium]|nr:LysE family translocator [Acetobacteraceae bacterium]
MEGAAWLISAAGFAVAMSATPGPNNAMIAASGANFGLRRSVPHMVGISLGFPAMLVIVALGLAAPLATLPGLQWVLRWAGAAWMLWIAWQIATAAPEGEDHVSGARPMTALAAALFQWINPKAWVIAGGAIATYTDTLAQALLLAAIFVPAAALSVLLWALIGRGAARALGTPERLRWFNRIMATLLVLSLWPVLAS